MQGYRNSEEAEPDYDFIEEVTELTRAARCGHIGPIKTWLDEAKALIKAKATEGVAYARIPRHDYGVDLLKAMGFEAKLVSGGGDTYISVTWDV